ncbi:12805_t:CDS:2 [Racocetra fulgida]|uniref:12805_t:CDS:1 n=1 Tax=Racocetra fulgida TaxID=60492 RepID=A0A9N9NHH5_9GLOM|nr:12805_t:CDS:2 [Racocetra fulgida]
MTVHAVADLNENEREHNDDDTGGARLDTGGKIGIILSVSIVIIGGKPLSEPEQEE